VGNFCVKCGGPLSGGPFCVKCGADARGVATPAQPQAVASPPQSVPTPAPQIVAAPAAPPVGKQGMSALAKLGIAAVVIIFVGGAAAIGGVYYVAHRVSQKIHEEARGILGPDSDSGGSSASRSGSSSDAAAGIDVCKLLSKEDVSQAIGVEIVRAEKGDGGCNYIAKGDQADMTAKHTTAMLAARGADKKSQDAIQAFAGGMFKQFQSEQPDAKKDTSGEVAVLSFSVDQNAADTQMQLNGKVFSALGSTENIPGIGDQAFITADSMMMVRKGKNLVRIMFMTCPCNGEAIKPLANKIANAL
jgi:hypothetical protein